MNKKGAVEISLNFVIIAAIILVVLIVAVLFLTGGAEEVFGEKQEENTSLETTSLSVPHPLGKLYIKIDTISLGTQEKSLLMDEYGHGYRLTNLTITSVRHEFECLKKCSNASQCEFYPDTCFNEFPLDSIKIENDGWNYQYIVENPNPVNVIVYYKGYTDYTRWS
jgi:hypothetical protein